ncbi:YdcF family protein [Leptothoe sp. LEGE 181152]|nr:YdcF family protein [Leptothoe sp. LEGE 181152]
MKLSGNALKQTVFAGMVGILLIWLGSIAIKFEMAAHQAPEPEAILVLGGGAGREERAAELAKNNSELSVWISSGKRLPEAAYAVFQAKGIRRERVYLDYQATDTVTNFTTLAPQFKENNIQHIYVVTSDFHMPRAKVIGTIVLGHSGMTFTPVSVPTSQPAESWFRIVRDGSRSFLWTVSGQTGEHVGRKLQAKLSQMKTDRSDN